MCSLMKTRRWFSAACFRPVRLKRRSSLTCVPIREEQIVKDSEKAKAKTPIEPGAQMPANHPKIDMENLPAGHPKIDGKQELPAGHPDISGAQKPAAK